VVQGFAVHEEIPAFGRLESGEPAEEEGLPRTRGTDDAEGGTHGEFQIDVPDPERIDLDGETTDLDESLLSGGSEGMLQGFFGSFPVDIGLEVGLHHPDRRPDLERSQFLIANEVVNHLPGNL